MKQAEARSAAFKGSITYTSKDGIQVTIPVHLYRVLSDTKVLPGAHMLHEACGERIRYETACPRCGVVERSEVVKAIPYGDAYVRLDKDEVKASLIGDGAVVEILYSTPSDDVWNALATGDAAIDDVLAVGSFRVGSSKAPLVAADRQLRTLLAALEATNRVLVVSVPDGIVRRHGVLLSTGVILLLRYEEEIRTLPTLSDAETPVVVSEGVTRFVEAIGGEFRTPSVAEAQARIEAMIEATVTQGDIYVAPKATVETVPPEAAEAFVNTLRAIADSVAKNDTKAKRAKKNVKAKV